ncbi:ribonuclease HI [Candidatus Omnitrophus magneticus]|uniref:Ribonuclease HI n=1 Tax=Candidatus Omnitrophus magneticus TaxID=1609969 RepID=A0A0F0CJ98_9BACT|nr:ribonuclease HI [Candidatus Omnitrophus magneticus]
MTIHAKKVFIFTDGGSRGNPGPSAIGVVLKDETGKVIDQVSQYIGSGTNNVAEYMAVVHGLISASNLGYKNISLFMDSQLIARHLEGSYKINDDTLKKYYGIIKALFKGFNSIEITEIPREQNKEADSLVNQALDSAMKNNVNFNPAHARAATRIIK